MGSVVEATGAPTARRAHKRGAGEGSIDQRPDGLWRGRVMVGRKGDGKPDVRVVYGKTRGDCQKKLDLLRRASEAGTVPDRAAGKETLAGFLDRWLQAIEGTVRPTTLARDRILVRTHLAPTVGRLKLSALRPEHLVQLYADKRKAGLAPRTV